jgi:hypothetical protein
MGCTPSGKDHRPPPCSSRSASFWPWMANRFVGGNMGAFRSASFTVIRSDSHSPSYRTPKNRAMAWNCVRVRLSDRDTPFAVSRLYHFGSILIFLICWAFFDAAWRAAGSFVLSQTRRLGSRDGNRRGDFGRHPSGDVAVIATRSSSTAQNSAEILDRNRALPDFHPLDLWRQLARKRSQPLAFTPAAFSGLSESQRQVIALAM